MDIFDRLKLYGARLERQSGQKPQEQITNQPSPFICPIETIVPGTDRLTEFGPTFLTNKIFAPDYIHGQVGLVTKTGMDMMAAWGKSKRLTQLKRSQIAFLDTETSGLAGGTGTYAFLVGLGFFNVDGFNVTQYFMRDPSAEPALLAALNEHLSSFQAIITFNGKSFDIPLLNTRYLLNRFAPPFTDLDHIDLLHLARRLWRDRLASRALGDLERHILGVLREQDEVPGYLIPQYYFDFLSTGDARPMAGVFYHNIIDIVSLAALFDHMANILESPEKSNLPSLDVVAVARLYEENGRLENAADLYESGLSAGLPETVYYKTIERLATLRRRQGRYDLAVALWEKAARLGSIDAYCELAKIYEHHLKHSEEALTWSLKGLILLQEKMLPKYVYQSWQKDFNKRIDRLRKKGVHESN